MTPRHKGLGGGNGSSSPPIRFHSSTNIDSCTVRQGNFVSVYWTFLPVDVLSYRVSAPVQSVCCSSSFPLKLGLRAGELLNIQLQDIALDHRRLKQHCPSLCSADAVSDYNDALYVHSKAVRDGNKSKKPRILPLDDETNEVLVQYLPTRQPVDEPWLILSQLVRAFVGTVPVPRPPATADT